MSSLGGATGILGGTFDPVHIGHLAVARQSLEQLRLESVHLVPSARPPHRQAPVASADERLEMARLAVAGIPGLVVDDIEVRRGGLSYMVDTLTEMRGAGFARLALLLGYDAALEIGGWHRAEDIQGLADVVVFNRSGVAAGPTGDAALPQGATVIEVDSPDVSASRVREFLAAGGDVSGMVTASVLEYIQARGLYGPHK